MITKNSGIWRVVQSFGKVRYIDPNSILQDRKYNTDTDNPQQYNIPF